MHPTPDTGYNTSHTHRIISADIECLALWRNPRSPSAQRRRDRVGDAARQGCGGVCRIRREGPYPPGLVTRREHPRLFRAVSAEASGCSRPRRHGGIPGSRWRRRRHPERGEGGPRRRETILGRGNHAPRSAAPAQLDRAAARRSLLASPRRQGGWSGFVSQMTPSTWGWMAHEARTTSQPHRYRPPLLSLSLSLSSQFVRLYLQEFAKFHL